MATCTQCGSYTSDRRAQEGGGAFACRKCGAGLSLTPVPPPPVAGGKATKAPKAPKAPKEKGGKKGAVPPMPMPYLDPIDDGLGDPNLGMPPMPTQAPLAGQMPPPMAGQMPGQYADPGQMPPPMAGQMPGQYADPGQMPPPMPAPGGLGGRGGRLQTPNQAPPMPAPGKQGGGMPSSLPVLCGVFVAGMVVGAMILALVTGV